MNHQNIQQDKMQKEQRPILTPQQRAVLQLVPSKPTLIGFDYHQIQVSDFPKGKSQLPRAQNYLQTLSPQIKPQPVFLASKVNQEQLDQYLKFAETYFQQKMPQFFSLNNQSKERMRVKAMDFLHEMNYNYTRAKFFIFFPYYRTYNKYRSHMPLNISDQQMEKKINDHIDSLKNTKEKDLQKWILSVQSSIQSRVHLSKLNTLIDFAKQNKFQIPDTITDQINKALKTGKQVKKTLQGVKLSIEKLVTKRDQILSYKIITSEMINFEQTVNRCEQWIKKQKSFEEKYFNLPVEQYQLKRKSQKMIDQNQQDEENNIQQEIQLSQEFKNTSKIISLKPNIEKIQYKMVSSLYNQFNNLPLKHQNFNQTTKKMYLLTQKLLQKLPPFIKGANTRKNNPTKSSYQQILNLLQETRVHPVYHQQFANFQAIASQAIQFIEKVAMFLEDQKSQKSVKVLNNYLKLINQGPIQSTVQQKLQSKLQYYQLMQKIKKDIMNPQKFQQIKESIKKLRQKGYECVQHANLEIKLMTIMGWSQSHQILSQTRQAPTIIELIKQQKQIKRKMINSQVFKEQLDSAKNQLNISEDIISDYDAKLKNIEQKGVKILQMIKQDSSNIKQMISQIGQCFKIGLKFPQFENLYEQTIKNLKILAKMYYILQIYTSRMIPDNQEIFLTNKQYEILLTSCNLTKNNLKSLKTRTIVQQILKEIQQNSFPKSLFEYRLFLQEIEQDNLKRKQILNMIQQFKEDDMKHQIKDIYEKYRFCFTCPMIDEELYKIQIIAKWRDKLNKKLLEEKQVIFDEDDAQAIEMLTRDLQKFQKQPKSNQQTKLMALQYFQQKSRQINTLLEKIAEAHIPQTYKLSQLNKFCKQVDKQFDKYQLSHKKITQLKNQLLKQIAQSDAWKQKYSVIKRFQEKKFKQFIQQKGSKGDKDRSEYDDAKSISLRQHQSLNLDKQDLNEQNMIYSSFQGKASEVNDAAKQNQSLAAIPEDGEINQSMSSPSKYRPKNYAQIIKNPQFYWYFKFILLIIQFYHGYKLKFSLQDVVKLRNTLQEINKYLIHYNEIQLKQKPTDQDLLSLEADGARITLFVRQVYITKVKVQYVQSWKSLANAVLKSVPIINMELKARNTQDLMMIIQQQKKEKENQLNQKKQDEKKLQESSFKRKRRPNAFYNNDEITLINQDTFGKLPKKRRKTNNGDGQYRTTAIVNQNKKDKQKIKQKDKKKQQQEIQDIQYTGQIVPQMLQVQDPQIYCICRQGVLNQNSYMVQCDGSCTQWFHYQCMGIKSGLNTKPQIDYCCIGCRQLWGQELPSGVGHFYWDSHTKMTRKQFLDLVQQGKQLGVFTQQLGKLQKIETKLITWQKQVQAILYKIFYENDLTNIQNYKIQVYGLYLHSFWLPTINHETQILKKVLINFNKIIKNEHYNDLLQKIRES